MTQTPTEYAALNFDGTERRGNYRTVAYRIDILHICEHKDAAAILFEIIYRWQTEVRKLDILKEVERRKKAGQPPLTEEEVADMMWVWMSYNDFVRECGGAIGYNTVIRTLDYLVGTAQIIECRENHDPRYPDYEYRIRMDVVKRKLKALPPAPVFLPKVPKKKEKKSEESTQVGTVEKRSTQKGIRALKSTQVGTVSTQTGIATTQVGTEVYPNGGTSHTYSHTSHIQHTEQECVPAAIESSAASATASADRDAHTQDDAHSPLQDESETKARQVSTTTTAAPIGKSAAPSEKPAQRAGGRKSTKTAEPEFTPEGRRVYDAWASLFKSPPDAGPKTILCANALYEKLMPWCYELKLTCKELLSDIKDWLFANQGDYYHGRGVKLCDVGREFEGWQSAKEDAIRNPNRQEPTTRKSSTRATSAAKDEDMVMWWDQQTGQQRLMTYAEADENGWEGGFGEFIQHTNYGRTVTA